MDDLDAILDDIDIVPAGPSTAAAEDLDALLDDAMDELQLPQTHSTTSAAAEADEDLDLAITSDHDKCMRLLGERAQTWRQWLVDDTPIKRSNLGVSRAYRSLYGGKDAQDFRVSTHPKPLLKGAVAKAATASRIPEAKRQALIEALTNAHIQPELESRYTNYLLETMRDSALSDPNFSEQRFPELAAYYSKA